MVRTGSARKSKIPALLFLAIALFGLGLALAYYPYQVDDANITYRYAVQLARGEGFAYNSGGPQVEGFSSPLWLLLLWFGARMFHPATLPLLAFLMGLSGFALGICLLPEPDAGETHAQRWPGWPAMVPVALFALNPAILFYSVSGLETILFLLTVIVFARATGGTLKVSWGIGAGMLALWIRPEGAWLIPMLLVQSFAQSPRRFFREKRFYQLAAAVIAGGITLLVTRLLLFHALLPNTYLAKPPVYQAAFYYVREYMGSAWGLSLFLSAVLGAWLGGRRQRGYLVAGLAWIVAVIVEGGDWMPVGRMLIPAFGLFILAAAGISRPMRSATNPEKHLRWRPALRLAAGIALFVSLIAGTVTIRANARIAQHSYNRAVYLDEVLSHWVRQSGVQSVAAIDIGIFGFLTPVAIVDLAGLTDRTIAAAPGPHLGKEFDLGYLFAVRKPDLIVIKTAKEPRFLAHEQIALQTRSLVENRIMTDGRMGRDYRFVLAFLPETISESRVGKLIFARREISLPARLVPAKQIIRVFERGTY